RLSGAPWPTVARSKRDSPPTNRRLSCWPCSPMGCLFPWPRSPSVSNSSRSRNPNRRGCRGTPKGGIGKRCPRLPQPTAHASSRAAAIAQAIDEVEPLMDARGHELMVTLPAQPIVLDADPVRLAQLLSNLLTNAAKHSPRPDRIWLSAQREGDGVVIRVRDHG